MASAAGSASTGAWMFRALALGSSCAVGYHLYPILSSTAAPHAVTLSQSHEPFLARSGVSRIHRQASGSSYSRQKLVSAGALPALAEAAGRADKRVREKAEEAMVEMMREEMAVREGVRDEEVMGVMVRVEGKEGERLWRMVLEVEGAAEEVRKRRVCERVRAEGLLKVLREGGAC